MKFVFALLVFALVGCGSGGGGGSGSAAPGRGEAMSYNQWNDLAGTYRVKNFGGTEHNDPGRTDVFENDLRYRARGGKNLAMMNMHLYHAYSSDGSASYNFGPFADFGTSSIIHDGATTTYIYDCANQDLGYNGEGYTLTLHIEATTTANSPDLAIKYTIAIPGAIDQVTHHYVMTRVH